MSFFGGDKIIYIVIPDADITEQMISEVKKDFYTTGDSGVGGNSLRQNVAQTSTLFKLKAPVSDIFKTYVHHNNASIKTVLNAGGW